MKINLASVCIAAFFFWIRPEVEALEPDTGEQGWTE